MRTIISILSIVITLSVATNVFAQSPEISFTQENRGRLVGLEVRLTLVDESLHRRLDDMKTFMMWGFGILLGDMGLLIGFIIWDRRIAISSCDVENEYSMGRF